MKAFTWVVGYCSLGVIAMVLFVQFDSMKEVYPYAPSPSDLHNTASLNNSSTTSPSLLPDRNKKHEEPRDIELLNRINILINLINSTLLNTPTNASKEPVTPSRPTLNHFLPPRLDPKNWKRDGYTSVRENEVS